MCDQSGFYDNLDLWQVRQEIMRKEQANADRQRFRQWIDSIPRPSKVQYLAEKKRLGPHREPQTLIDKLISQELSNAM